MATNAIKYISNVGKSVVYSTVDHIKNSNPAITGFVDTNNDILKSSYDAITHIRSTAQSTANKLMDSRYGDIAKKGFANIKEDIATGKFYNRERIDKIDSEMANKILGGDDDFDFSEDSFSMDDSSSSSSGLSVEDLDAVGEKTSTAISSIIARTSEESMRVNMKAQAMNAKERMFMFNKIHSGLGSINTNITTLMQFATGPMQTHLDNSTKFYSTATDHLTKQTSLLEELVKMQKESMIPQKDRSSKSSKIGMYDILDSNGMPDLEAFFKRVKQNIKANDSGMLDMIDFFFESGAMEAMVASPMQFVTDAVAKKLIPKLVTDSMKSFNASLTGVFPGLLMKLQNSESDNPIINFLKTAFDVSESVSKTMNTGDYEKGKVPFDGITRKSIVEVIPTYLSKIYSVLSGKEEDRYNYQTGRFEKMSDIQKAFNDRYENMYRGSTRDLEQYMIGVMKETANFNEQAQEQFTKDLKSILQQVYQSGNLFDVNSLDAKTYGLKGGKASEVNVKLIKEIWEQTPYSMKNVLPANILSDRSRHAKDSRSGLSNMDSNFVALFNESGEFANKVKKQKSKKEEAANKSHIGRYFWNKTKDKDAEDEYEYILKDNATVEAPKGGVLFNIYDEVKLIRELIQQGSNAGDSNVINKAIERHKRKFADKKSGKATMESYLKGLSEEEYQAKAKLWKSAQDRKDAQYDQAANALTPEVVKAAAKQYMDNNREIGFIESAIEDLNSDSLRRIYKSFVGAGDAISTPMKPLAFIFNKGEEMIYKLIFGTNRSPEQEENEKIGILGTIQEEAKKTFSDFRGWMEENIFEPLAKNLEEGLGKKFLEKLGINVDEFIQKHTGDGTAIGDFKERFVGQFKKTGLFVKDTVKDAASRAADTLELTRKKNESGIAKTEFNQRLANVTDFLSNMKAGVGEVENAAAGMKRVSKTGVVAVSEGEMIVPADLNPFNIKNNLKDENKAKDKFTKAFGKMDIPNFANGGTYNSSKKKDRKAKRKVKKEKEQSTFIDEILDKYFEDGNIDNLKESLKDKSDDVINKVKEKIEKSDKYKKKELNKEDYLEGRDKGIFGKAVDIIFDSAKQAGDRIKEGVTQIILDKKEQESECRKFLSIAWDEIKKNVPEMAAGGAIGAGVSLFTGGIINPLFGAALGAGISLLSNSKSVQAALFGEEVEENGEKKFKKGLLPENFSKNIQKYVPAMAKGGVVGALASLIPGVPGGPVAGLILGSAVGFASKNETIKEALFGNEEKGKKGILPKDFMDRVKKALPKGVAGGIIGAFTGPFGLVTNIAVGSAIGLATETDTVKKFLFGDKEKDEKGWLQKMGDHAIGKIKEAWDPLKKQMEIFGGGIKKFFEKQFDNFFKEHLGTPMDKIMKSISDHTKKILGGFLKGLMMPITGLLKLPFNVIGGVGNHYRKKHIARGTDDYDTAAQRLLFRKKHRRQLDRIDPRARRYERYDQQMADMDNDQISGTLKNLKELQSSNDDINSNIGLEDQMTAFRENITNNMNLGWRQTHKLAKGAYKAIGGEKDPTKIAHKMNTYIAGLDLSEEEKKKVADAAGGLFAAVNEKNKKREEFKGKQDSAFKSIAEKFGFKVENADDMGKLIKQFEFEAKSRGINTGETPESEATNNLNDAEEKRHKVIVSEIEEIKEILKALKDNQDKDAISKKEQELSDQFRDVNELNPTTGIRIKKGLRIVKGQIKKDISETSELIQKSRAAKDETNTGLRNILLGNNSIDHKADIYTRDLITGAMIDEDGNPITTATDEYNTALNAHIEKRVAPIAKLLLGAKGFKDRAIGGAKKIATKVKYAFTSDAKPVRYIEDKSGKYTVDKSDADTAKTVAAIEKKEEEQNNMWSKITSLPSTLGRLFGFKKEDVEGNDDDEGFLSKFIKKASIAAGLVVGAPLLTGIWSKDIWPKLKPILEPLGDKFKEATNSLWTKFKGWLTGTPVSEDGETTNATTTDGKKYGLPGIMEELGVRWQEGANIITDKILPWAVETLLPRAVQLLVAALPKIAEGLANGLATLFGMPLNTITSGTKPSTKPDSVSYSEFKSEERNEKSEELLGKERTTIGQGVIATAGEAAIRGWNKGTAIGKAGKALTNSPIAKTITKPVGWLMQGVDTAITGAGKLGNKILYSRNSVNGMTKEAGESSWKKILGKVTGNDIVDVAVGVDLKTGETITESMARSEALAKGFDLDTITTSSKSKSSKVLSKVDDVVKGAKTKITGAMDTISQKAIGTLDNLGNKGLLGKIITHVRSAISKLFGNKQVIAKFSQVMKVMGGVGKEAGEKVAAEVAEKLSKKLVKWLTENAATKIAGAVGKLAGGVASAGLINIAFGVKGFIDGWNNTNDTLGIAHNVREASILEKLVSGIVGGINEFACLGLIPVGIIVDLLLPILNKIPGINSYTEEIIEAREDSAEIVAQFNEENGTNLTVEEYNELIENGKQGVVSKFFKGDKAYIDENGKLQGAKVDKDGKITTTGKKGIFQKAGDSIKKGFNTVKGALFGDKESGNIGALPAFGQVISNSWKWAIGKSKKNAYDTIVDTVDKDDPVFSMMKFMAKVTDTVSTPLYGIVKIGKGIWDKASGVFKTMSAIGGRIASDTKDGISDLWKGDIKSFFNITKENDDDENPLSPFRTILKGVSRAVLFPVSGIIYLGGRIKDGIASLVKGAGTAIGNVFNTEKQLISEAYTGKPSINELINIFDVSSENDGDGPLSWVSLVLRSVTRVFTGPVAAIGTIGNWVVGGIKGIIDGAKTSIGSVIDSEKTLIGNAFSGKANVTDIFQLKSENDAEGALGWVSVALRGISRTVTAPISLVGMTGSFIKDKLSPVIEGGKTAINIIKQESERLKTYKEKDSLKGYWENATKNDEGGIIGGFADVANTIMRVLMFPVYLLRTVVNNVKDKIDDATKGVKTAFSKFKDWFLGGSDSLAEDAEKDYSGKGSRLFTGKGFISQKDPAIANKKFGNETIGEAGCAPASAMMAASGTFDKAVNVAKKYQNSDGVSAGYFKDYFNQQGIASEYTGGSSDIKANLRSGNNVVLGGQDAFNTSKTKSPFGPSGHYVVANGLSRDGKYISINDPEANRPNIIYPAKKVLSHTRVGVATKGKGSKAWGFNGKGFKAFRGRATLTADDYRKENLGSFSPLTAEQMNEWIAQKNSSSPFNGNGQVFVDASNATGLDPRYILAHAALESAWGTSKICKEKNNYFGIGAFDSSPYSSAYSFNSGLAAGIIEGVKWIKTNYYDRGQRSLYKMRNNNGSHQYATDPEWDIKIAKIMASCPYPNEKYTQDEAALAAPGVSDNISSSGESSGGTWVDNLLGVFDKLSVAYGLSTDSSGTSSSNSTDYGISGNTSSNPELAAKQKALVEKMYSIKGTLKYSQSARNPDNGSGDCSSTVQWAYKNILGVDPGSYTGAQRTDNDTYTVQGATGSIADESKLQLGDLLLKQNPGHVEMYAGNGQMIGHGGGADGSVNGPTVSSLPQSGSKYTLVRRWNGFKGTGSGLDENSTIVRYAKGASNSTSHSSERNIQPGLSRSTKAVIHQSRNIEKYNDYDIFAKSDATTNAQPGTINYTGQLNTIIRLLGNVVSNTALLEQMVTLLTTIITIMSEEEQAKKDNNQEKLQQLKGQKNKLLTSLNSVSSKTNDEQIAILVKNAEKLARS